MRRYLLPLLVILCWLSLGLAVWAQSGAITGQVLNASLDPPQPAADVRLLLYQAEASTALQETRSDGQGRFAFDALAIIETGQRYWVAALFQGATYYGDPIQLSPLTDTIQYTLPVYETTADDSQVLMRTLHLLTSLQGTKLRVQEIALVENIGRQAVLGAPLESLGGKPSSLHFSLPDGALDLSFQDAQVSNAVMRTPDGFVETRPIPPGRWQYAYSYTLDAAQAPVELTRQWRYSIDSLNVLAEEQGLEVQAEGVVYQGTRQMMGTAFAYWAAESVAAAAPITLRYATLDAQTSVSASTRDRWWPIVALALVALAAAAFVAAPFWLSWPKGETRS